MARAKPDDRWTGDLMIERVRGPSELRSIAQRAHALLWRQSAADAHGDVVDRDDELEAQAILRRLAPDEHSAVIKLLRLWACNA